jgi:hypothetical protein
MGQPLLPVYKISLQACIPNKAYADIKEGEIIFGDAEVERWGQ